MAGVFDIIGGVLGLGGLFGGSKKPSSPYDAYLKAVGKQGVSNLGLSANFLPQFAQSLGYSLNRFGNNFELAPIPGFDPMKTPEAANFTAQLASAIPNYQALARTAAYLGKATGDMQKGQGLLPAEERLARYIADQQRAYLSNFYDRQRAFQSQIAAIALGASPIDPTGRQTFAYNMQQDQLQGLMQALAPFFRRGGGGGSAAPASYGGSPVDPLAGLPGIDPTMPYWG